MVPHGCFHKLGVLKCLECLRFLKPNEDGDFMLDSCSGPEERMV